MTFPPHMPEGSEMHHAPHLQHPLLDRQLAMMLGRHEAQIMDLQSARIAQGERMGRLENSIAEVKAGQAAADATRAAQHAETMTQMENLRDGMTRFERVPGDLAVILERLGQHDQRDAMIDADMPSLRILGTGAKWGAAIVATIIAAGAIYWLQRFAEGQ